MRKYLHPRYWAVVLMSLAQFLAFGALTLRFSETGAGGGTNTGGLIFGVGMLAFGLVGAVIIAKIPGNRIGWVFAFIGILGPLSSFQQLAVGLLEAGVNVGVLAIGQLLADIVWSAFFLCLIVLIPLWYPTGTAINRYFGLAAPFAIAGWFLGILGLVGESTTRILVNDSLPQDEAWLEIPNPLADWPVPDLEFFDIAATLFILPAGIIAVVALVVRTVKSRGVERLQMKWLLFTEGLFVVFVVFVVPLEDQIDTLGPGLQLAFNLLLGALVLAVPISVGIAITKHRLYDIDVVISKTVTYGALALFITGVYALMVVGIGSLIGSGDDPDLLLSIAAVAIVAVAFEPLRNRLQRWANRLVFGPRATPYEVLSKTTARLAAADSPDDALAQVTQLVVDGTGAEAAVLWLQIGDHLIPSAATPRAALDGLTEMLASGDSLPALPGNMSTPVRHQGEILGALSITKPLDESVTGVDEKMLQDVASGTGLLLRNIGLNSELAQRAEQLRVSRRRLVTAHDAERHRLERNLHDGAQQQVVAIKVKLGIARTLAKREDAFEVQTLVSSLADATQEAVDAMRAVAHGIYPPLLEAEGLGVALTAASRTTPVPIDLAIETVGRYGRSVEESVYFCILETITHAVDGGATWIRVDLGELEDSLRFTVHHDGTIVALHTVEDRVAAFGGFVNLTTNSKDEAVSGELPSVDAMALTS